MFSELLTAPSPADPGHSKSLRLHLGAPGKFQVVTRAESEHDPSRDDGKPSGDLKNRQPEIRCCHGSATCRAFSKNVLAFESLGTSLYQRHYL